MNTHRLNLLRALLTASLTTLLMVLPCAGQGAYTAQVRGLVTDSTHAVVSGAKVTITNDGTNISTTATTDANGLFLFASLRPSTYTMTVEASGFRTQEQKSVVLAVDQQTSLNFTLQPAGTSTTIDVTTAAPLLDTENATIGTDVTNEYVKDIPLANRSYFGLVFLSGGVTETTGSGVRDNYPAGTNFVSNGQRNATAEIRLDGALISAPEQGEGATNNVYYQPSVEIVQEFKVQNNSFSSEFGNNGGTVVNVVLKSGTNNFHGAGWWFPQRSTFDARDPFNPAPATKPDEVRDQYGFAIGGPVRKGRTFFFFDFEKVRQQDAINILASVPTLPERTGDFSATAHPIYDPLQCPPPPATCIRPLVPNQQIPANEIDTIGQKIINLYPKPTITDPTVEINNFRSTTSSNAPQYQFDIKLDHELTRNQHLSARYSHLHSDTHIPTVFGDSLFGPMGDGIKQSPVSVDNAALEHTWTVSPNILWTSRIAVDRAKQTEDSTGLPTLASAGLPAILGQGNNVTRMPTIQLTSSLGQTNLFDQCCLDTKFAHTLSSYSSALQIVRGRQLFKLGGEQRLFYNNFFQPPYPSGIFDFADTTTSQNLAGDPNGNEGNPFATLLFGFPDNSSQINIVPSVANRSRETAFYFQDDWKITPRLTVNLGVRYEWSTPYSDRHNRLQFSNFNGDSGINVPGLGDLKGTTIFASSGRRSVPVDRNNLAPRVGFAYQLDQHTVIRGGAGIYYGLSAATNYQYPGTAFRRSLNIFFSQDNYQHRSNTLANPFPNGLQGPEGTKYGPLAQWGFINQNDLGTQTARNAEIYQWNLGVQRLLPGQIVLAGDYSASRATHLPWSGYSSTRNRNLISSDLLAQLVQQMNPTHDPQNTAVSDYLSLPVTNPFLPLFSGPNAIFGEPQSQYGNATIPQVNLLRPYPQFDGNFEGLPLLAASSWYHSMQIRFQKRASHYVSFEGNYTLSKSTDTSSTGANAFVGYLNNANPQQLDRLNKEHSITANDATHRFVAAVIVDIPVGRDRWLGRDLNRGFDAVVGGWALSTVFTRQSGQPLPIYMASNRLEDGNQRASVICPQLRSGLSSGQAAHTGGSFFNVDANGQPVCIADPGDQIPGNAPRFFSNLRSDGVHNLDLAFYKEFTPREGMTLQVRVDSFNAMNTPRYAPPNTSFSPGNPGFGLVTQSANGYNPRHLQFGVRFQF